MVSLFSRLDCCGAGENTREGGDEKGRRGGGERGGGDVSKLFCLSDGSGRLLRKESVCRSVTKTM